MDVVMEEETREGHMKVDDLLWQPLKEAARRRRRKHIRTSQLLIKSHVCVQLFI